MRAVSGSCSPRLAAPGSRRRAALAAEIIAFDGVVVVYKFIGDLHFYATADAEENEIILTSVLTALTESVTLLLTCAHAAGVRRALGRTR